MAARADLRLIFAFCLLISPFISESQAAEDECTAETGSCVNKSDALPLKIIIVASILITSMIGVCLPLFSRAFPALQPDKELFIVIKVFASGIILNTGFMHVLPGSFDVLSSSCLSDNPWHKFPFTGFVGMLSAIFTLMGDSLAASAYTKKNSVGIKPTEEEVGDTEMVVLNGPASHFHGHSHHAPLDLGGAQLLRYRVVAMVLELGIVVHLVVIGLRAGPKADANDALHRAPKI